MSTTQDKEDADIKSLYGRACILPKDDFIKQYGINENGLTTEQAQERLKKYGLNQISGIYLHLLIASCFGIVLILFYTDVYLAEKPSYANIIVILVLVTASTLLEFFEEFRSNKAAEKLKELVATNATVLRDGKEIQIPIKEVTLGDIVLLSAGSMIPADLRVLQSKDVYVGQSSLTGEAESVRKLSFTQVTLDEIDNVSDLDTICFMGTNVISGSAKCAVIKTADSTYFGKVAKNITNNQSKSAFQKGIENISKLLIKFMFILTPIVFILNAWKHSPVTAFTFAVAIAICITPLLLPVILSSSLSKGAVKMSKKKTIVKKLDSIQSFGAMNILCTDKTRYFNRR